ncbi:hypothetical protein LQZ21_05185, partial [Treponema sp. TIM-1]
MEEVLNFLKDNNVFYVATTDEGRPSIRPFGAVTEINGKLYEKVMIYIIHHPVPFPCCSPLIILNFLSPPPPPPPPPKSQKTGVVSFYLY